jgi:hypothetical protein
LQYAVTWGSRWLLVVVAGLLIAYVNRGGNQYGPRFYYEAALFAILFTTANLFAEPLFEAKPPRDQRLWMAVAINVACLAAMFAYHLYAAGVTVRERRSPYSAAHACRPRPGSDHHRRANRQPAIDGRAGSRSQ